MAIQFPSNPAVNDTYTYNSRTWVWSGTRWIVKFGIGSNPKDIIWLTTQTSNFTAQSGFGYPVNTTSAAITVTLPASPSAGDQITLTDYAGTFGTNNMVVAGNGNKINGSLVPATFATNQSSVQLVYVDATQGWKAYSFSVTSLTQTIPVDYLVVAGGGAGASANGAQGGAGGAGGFRTNTAFTVLVNTSYTVTVGAGGAAGSLGNAGSNGSDSVFSTITSTGGGKGGLRNSAGSSGGSGGGGGDTNGSTPGAGGSGNTPSTSPSQGNNGGAGSSTTFGGSGGGGGASATGSSGSGANGGAGGNGSASSITGASITYAGGGGGAGNAGISGVAANGGSGGGGAGAVSPNNATAGTVNLGGGGGGASSALGGAGGSGVVIIAYPNGYPALASIGAGLTYDQPTRSGYRVYRFTAGTGTISW